MKDPSENTNNSFEPGWYIVLFIPGNNPALPGKQPKFDVVYLDSPLAIDCLEEFDRPARHQGRGRIGRPSTNPILVQFGHMLHHDYPGVYSIGPFATSDQARETLDQQLLNYLHLLISTRTGEFERTFRVMDLTTGIVYDNAYKAAVAIGGDSYEIRRVCRGTRKTSKGHRWAYEDPEALGVPIPPEKILRV